MPFPLFVLQVAKATFAIGAAEIVAELFNIAFLARIGVFRASKLGHFVTAAAYALLGVLAGPTRSLASGLVGVFLCVFTFEVTIVALMGASTQVKGLPKGVCESATFMMQARQDSKNNVVRLSALDRTKMARILILA